MGLVRQSRRRGSSRGVWLVGAPRNPGSRQTDRRSRATRADGVVRAGRAQRDTGTAPAQIQAYAGGDLEAAAKSKAHRQHRMANVESSISSCYRAQIENYKSER